MSAAVGLYLVACVLLAVAGGAKVRRPGTTALALTRLRPRWRLAPLSAAVRVLAGAEAAIGVAGLVYPDAALAIVVAASFAAFTAVVLYARRRGGPLATCGCFGEPDTPPTVPHALLDAVLAAGAAAFAAAGTARTLPGLLSHQYASGLPLLAAAALCAWLAYLVMVPVARLAAVAGRATGTVRS